MQKHLNIILLITLNLFGLICFSQPAPCDLSNPEMTSFCDEACIICDIDGFTGRHEATIVGEAPPGFAGECTITAHNMQWIAFIAGSVNLKVRMDVSNCENNLGLEFGLYKGINCTDFVRISNCFGGFSAIGPGEHGVIENTEPLEIGQYYFIVMDGGLGDNCDWTFTVEEGSTTAAPLSFTREIEGPKRVCPDLETIFTTEAEIGATLFFWTLDGVEIGNPNSDSLALQLQDIGTYTLCVTAANACDEASPTCTQLEVITPPVSFLSDSFCQDDCYDIDGNTYCASGVYEYIIPLSNGCDSTIVLDLIELEMPMHLIDINICEGDTVFIENQLYTETDFYEQIVLTENDCDSLIQLDLFVVICDIEANAVLNMPRCFDESNGSISFSVINGTPPYSYMWKNLSDTEFSAPQNITANGLAVTIENIPAGQYVIEIHDAFDNKEILLEELLNPAPIMSTVTISDFNGFAVLCSDSSNGFIDADISGGVAPLQISWSNGANSTRIDDLSADVYTLNVADINGCTFSDSYEILAPPPITGELLLTDPNCDGLATGTIQIENLNGGVAPFEYKLNDLPVQSSELFENLSPDNYSYQVIDANACSSEFSASLSAPEIPVIMLPEDTTVSLGESLTIAAQINAISVGEINWMATELISCSDCLEIEVQPLFSSEYAVEVSSEDGCVRRESIFVEVEKQYNFYVPNIFSPNGDGANDDFQIFKSSEVDRVDLYIYDRWGNLMFADLGTDVPWDGRVNGKELGVGVYTWIAEVRFIDGVTETYSGNVSLIR